MTWQDQLKGDPLPWLLEPGDPGVRYLALRDLVGLPESATELQAARKAAHQADPIAAILAEMDPAGYWVEPGSGYNPKYRSTVWSLILLAQLGARIEEDARIARACRYFLENGIHQGGQISTSSGPGGTVDCLQGNLCWSLVELGCDDPRLDMAYEWMARSVTGEGIAPMEDRQAPVRYYAGKCGPLFACGANNKLACAWGAAKVLPAFSRLPVERRTPLIGRAIQQGIAFLFGVEPSTAAYPTGYSDKPSGNWWKFGFPVFYITDLLQVAEALAASGCGHDPRLEKTLALIRDKQDDRGRWSLEFEYTSKTWYDFGAKKAPNKWVTLRALRVLKAVA